MEDLSWKRISLIFPEWANNPAGQKEKSSWKDFKEIPLYQEDGIYFLFKKEYGIQLFLNQKIPAWLKDSRINFKDVEKVYHELSEKIYAEVLGELEKNFKIFESWRKYIQKFNINKREWAGNLSNHVEFIKEFDDEVYHYDYYQLKEENRNGHSLHPTDKLLFLQKINPYYLNEEMKKYHALSNIVIHGRGDNSCNIIKGRTLTECIANADEIYKLAPELEKKIQMD